MRLEELASALGGTLLDSALEVGEACTWRECRATEPLVLVEEQWWCLDHGQDSALPPVFSSSHGICAQCGKGATRALADGTKIHPDCVRSYHAKRAEPTVVKGAYARRMKKG